MSVNPLPQPSLPQFAHITRYWDAEHRCHAARILPGEYYVTTHEEMISTVLGSCVSACVRDSRLGIGGMNHFMLPEDASRSGRAWGAAVSAATRYGDVAMRKLIEDILSLGGRAEDLEVKLVGGGQVLAEMNTDIGLRNVEFVREYVREHGLQVLGEDLGGAHARRVLYFPRAGRLRVRELTAAPDSTVISRERLYLQELEGALDGNELP